MKIPGWVDSSATAVLTLQRFLFGVMFTLSGSMWFRRDDSVGYLRDALEGALEEATATFGYEAFLRGVVLEWPTLFTGLVGVGELAVGVALVTGLPPRLGAAGGVFLAVNYGLAFGGTILPPSGNFALAALMLPLCLARPYRHLVVRLPGRQSSSMG